MPNASHPDAPAVWNNGEDITLDKVKPGDRLVCDDGFVSDSPNDPEDDDYRCIAPWSILTVKDDLAEGLYVPCGHGVHMLDGQEREDGTLAGMRKVKDA